MAASLQIVDKGVQRKLRAIRSQLSKDSGAVKAGGRAVGNLLQLHLRKLNSERANKLGGKRTNFYAAAARGVQQPEATARGLKVTISHVGIAQRYAGGTIVPKKAQWLTIPARAEAYGKRAGEFDGLIFMQSGPDKAVLKEPEGGVMFWLRKRVTQQPDPSVLPTDAQLGEAFVDTAKKAIERKARRA